MQNQGLLFIPDISGFTKFVNETEVEHSRLIIQELLEILIDANRIGLQVSEIEGDAILFYKFGEPPDLDQLRLQVEEMFCAFHKALMTYDVQKYCQCKACTSAIGLSLKVISHFGEFTHYQVKEFTKLIGKDVIIAHHLLKNDIQPHEYWLVTSTLMTGQKNLPANMIWEQRALQEEKQTVTFFVAPLTGLKQTIEPDPIVFPTFTGLYPAISLHREYPTDMITMFHATGDFNHRHRWRDGVKKVEEVNHFLPRVGMRCKCVYDDGESSIYSSSYRYSTDRIEFTESDETRKTVTRYLLEAIEAGRTRLTLTYYIPNTLTGRILFSLGKRQKIFDSLRKSMDNLSLLLPQIKLPTITSESL
jgi:hypothetical protein